MVQGGGFEPPKLSRQIYSLIPLATREPLRKGEAFSAHQAQLSTTIYHDISQDSKKLVASIYIMVRKTHLSMCNKTLDIWINKYETHTEQVS